MGRLQFCSPSPGTRITPSAALVYLPVDYASAVGLNTARVHDAARHAVGVVWGHLADYTCRRRNRANETVYMISTDDDITKTLEERPRLPASRSPYLPFCFYILHKYSLVLVINHDEKNRLPEIISNFDLTCSEKHRSIIIHGYLFLIAILVLLNILRENRKFTQHPVTQMY